MRFEVNFAFGASGSVEMDANDQQEADEKASCLSLTYLIENADFGNELPPIPIEIISVELLDGEEGEEEENEEVEENE